MNVVLITLLLGFGSLFVETDQVNVCIPGVAIHVVCALTVAGVPVGPGYETLPPPQDIPSIAHSTSTLCGNDAVEERATRTALNITESPACGFCGVIWTDDIAQSVSRTAAGGNVFVTAGGCDIEAKLHRKAVHVGDVEVKV